MKPFKSTDGYTARFELRQKLEPDTSVPLPAELWRHIYFGMTEGDCWRILYNPELLAAFKVELRLLGLLPK